MPIRESSHGYWSSGRAFVFVAAGAAIGIGNIARVPYLASQYGGSVFIGAYLLALLLVAWPVLVMELSIGRWARGDLIAGLQRFAESASARRQWVWLGLASLAGGVLILSYYSVIAGWSLAYVFRSAGGLLAEAGPEGLSDIFYSLAQDPERGLAWHTVFIVMACIVVSHGVFEGIEHAARYLAPAALVLMGALFVYALTFGDAAAAMQNLLAPDFARFGWRGAMEAIHQAFFTMALGLGAMTMYGSYLPARAPLGWLALAVVVFDTLFGLVGGFALYALVFAAGLDPAPGLTLLFQVFPRAVPDGAAGILCSTLVYVVMVIITLTSAVALMEPATRFLMERQRTTRVFAAATAALTIWYLGLLTLLSFNVLRDLTLFGGTIFDWLQNLSSVLLPASTLLLCTFVARIIPRDLNLDAWGDQPRWMFHAWLALVRYPARLAMILLLAYVTGLIGFLVSLWS